MSNIPVTKNVDALDVRDFGASPFETAAHNKAAFVDCFDAAKTWLRPIVVPAYGSDLQGNPDPALNQIPYLIDGDLEVDWKYATITGSHGQEAHLRFVDGSFIVGGTVDQTAAANRFINTDRTFIAHLHLSREGTFDDYVVKMPEKTLVAGTRFREAQRFHWHNISIDGNTYGGGLLLESQFTGGFTGLRIRACQTQDARLSANVYEGKGAAIYVKKDPSTVDGRQGINDFAFVDTKLESCTDGIVMERARGVTFSHTLMQSMLNTAIWSRGDNRGVTFQGGYFEANARNSDHSLNTNVGNRIADIVLGDPFYDAANGGPGGLQSEMLLFEGMFCAHGAVDAIKQHAVWVENGQSNMQFDSCLFKDFGVGPPGPSPANVPPIRLRGAANTSTGRARYCSVTSQPAGTPVVRNPVAPSGPAARGFVDIWT